MRKENQYFIWNKNDNLTLSKYFNTKEFDCQCKYADCIEQRVSIQLIEKLDLIRIELNRPIKVTSGFRCSKHQNDLRNQGVNTVVAKKSTHETGDAVDIQSKDVKVEDLLKICEKQIESIGIAKTFLHLDTRPGKRRWNY